ncbi:MAG TPA: ABC transporter substrate-binding protein [Conexibacter sp.]|nr:ABC transporter substrate-binding protein [Conexibacter sp.]
MFGRALSRLALTLVACASVSALAGCGGGAKTPEPLLRSPQLTIWSSAPQHGPLRAVSADVVGAERLALAQDGGRVGRYRVRLFALDAATPGLGRSDPAQMSQNARRAAKDPRTVAYLGELATGSSAISIPLLNEAGILEVSPLDPAMALTTANLAVAGSPERYYPKLRVVGRTFARVVPSDRTEVDALLAAMRGEGVRRLAILSDEDPSGRALATSLRAKAHAAGIAVVAWPEIDEDAPQHPDVIAALRAADVDGALDATGARPGAARLWRELSGADPGLQLFAPASLADPSFVAGLGPEASRVAHVTLPLPPPAADAPAARRFARAFAARYGHAPAPEAVYGYEAMRSVLAAIHDAERREPEGVLRRSAVVHAYFRTAPRAGVLGPYAIEPSGDSSLHDWSLYRVAGGRLRFAGALDAGSAER